MQGEILNPTNQCCVYVHTGGEKSIESKESVDEGGYLYMVESSCVCTCSMDSNYAVARRDDQMVAFQFLRSLEKTKTVPR